MAVGKISYQNRKNQHMDRRSLIKTFPFLAFVPFFQIAQTKSSPDGYEIPTDEDIDTIYNLIQEGLTEYDDFGPLQRRIYFPIELIITTTTAKTVGTHEKTFWRIGEKARTIIDIATQSLHSSKINSSICISYSKSLDPTITFNKLMERFQPIV